jgi:hypothetical protein
MWAMMLSLPRHLPPPRMRWPRVRLACTFQLPMLLHVPVTRKGTFNAAFRAPLRSMLSSINLSFAAPPPSGLHARCLGDGCGALAMLFASHESSFRLPAGCYIMAAHMVVGLTPGHASHFHTCLQCTESPGDLRGSRFSSTISPACMGGERTPISNCPCSWTISVVVLARITLFDSMAALFTLRRSSWLRRGG